ncbi:hypothetical protein CPB84DRAFT_1789651, partial [Gymnopilus junonius]
MTSQLHPFWSTKRGIFLVLLIIAAIVGVIVGGVIGGRNARGGNLSGSTPRSSTTRRASTATSSESTSSSGGAVTPSTSHTTATSTAVPSNTISYSKALLSNVNPCSSTNTLSSSTSKTVILTSFITAAAICNQERFHFLSSSFLPVASSTCKITTTYPPDFRLPLSTIRPAFPFGFFWWYYLTVAFLRLSLSLPLLGLMGFSLGIHNPVPLEFFPLGFTVQGLYFFLW